MRRMFLVTLGATALVFGACDDGGGGDPNGQPDVQTTFPDSQQDISQPDIGQPDVTVDSTDAGPDAEEEVAQCANPGNKPIMAACAEDCECASGYCYTEAFLGDFSFCSVDCSTGDPCSSIKGPNGTQIYQCLNMSSSDLKTTYGLTVTSLCALRCESVDDCKALSSEYDACGNDAFGTSWDDHTIGTKTCLISAEIDP